MSDATERSAALTNDLLVDVRELLKERLPVPDPEGYARAVEEYQKLREVQERGLEQQAEALALARQIIEQNAASVQPNPEKEKEEAASASQEPQEDFDGLLDAEEPERAAESNLRIEGTWLVRTTNDCTCASHYGAHQPGCGMEPEVDLSTLGGWQSMKDTHKADGWDEGYLAGFYGTDMPSKAAALNPCRREGQS